MMQRLFSFNEAETPSWKSFFNIDAKNQRSKFNIGKTKQEIFKIFAYLALIRKQSNLADHES